MTSDGANLPRIAREVQDEMRQNLPPDAPEQNDRRFWLEVRRRLYAATMPDK